MKSFFQIRSRTINRKKFNEKQGWVYASEVGGGGGICADQHAFSFVSQCQHNITDIISDAIFSVMMYICISDVTFYIMMDVSIHVILQRMSASIGDVMNSRQCILINVSNVCLRTNVLIVRSRYGDDE